MIVTTAGPDDRLTHVDEARPRQRSARDRRGAMTSVQVAEVDITTLEVDAIANAANTRAAARRRRRRRRSRAPAAAVQERERRARADRARRGGRDHAGDLPARWVIHAATMELGGPTSADDHPPRDREHAAQADELGARSLALVAFGTGVGGFPLEEAARIEVEEVRRRLDAGSGLERVVFAVRGGRGPTRAFQRALAEF